MRRLSSSRAGAGQRNVVHGFALALALLWSLGCSDRAPAKAPSVTAGEHLEISRAGSRPSTKGASGNFTGSVEVTPLFQTTAHTRASGASVAFQPGARSAWHSHPAGQTLVVTSGMGWVQEWGGPKQELHPSDVVWTPPGVKHWHGATPSSAMTHTAIQEHVNGKVVDWLEPVSDEQYGGTAQTATPPPRPVYYVSEFVVTDAEGMKLYSAAVTSTFESFGGRYIVRGGDLTSLEGDPPRKMVIIAFDSVEQAKAWYESPAHRALRPIRQRAATSQVYLVEGTPLASAADRPAVAATEQGTAKVVRVAELEIDPAQLEKYLAIVKEEMEESIRVEPGVLALHAAAHKDDPTKITFFEMYADEAAYLSHRDSPHFKRYVESTKAMIRARKLMEMTPVQLSAKTR
jgi:quercetin dioxygenase-like cupin family protein/uncharacterized protein (DUF1330 family)/quinol monooxygenase YgiN